MHQSIASEQPFSKTACLHLYLHKFITHKIIIRHNAGVWQGLCRAYPAQGPHSQIFMTGVGGGGGGLTEVYILYPKKSQLQNLSTQKNHYFFFNIPKKIP